jgi:acetylornithine deacetylase/succinyl-diaminopimelate desuccinylase-like protein
MTINNKNIKDNLKSVLKDLVGIRSVFPEEKSLGEFIIQLLKKNGYNTKIQKVEKNRFNVLVEKGKGRKSVLLYSHLDTVGITKGWKTDPFELKIIGDRAFGLGAWDMKGGMAVNILSFLNYQPKNFRLKLVFCVDEENIYQGVYQLVKSDFFNDVDCIISTEPAFIYGNQGIVIGRPGRAVFQIIISGKPNHYALYNHKIDINFFVADLINDLSRFYIEKNGRKQFIFARNIQSETIGMSTPHTVKLELDSSIIPPTTSNKIKQELINICRAINQKFNNYFTIEVDFKKRKTPFLESYEIDKKNNYLKILKKSILLTTGKKAKPYFRSSIADENVFGFFGKTVLGIGPEGGNAHSPNEWVSIQSLMTLYQILLNFFYQLENENEKKSTY